MLHMFKCLFGSCVRTLNWLLLANVLITAVRVLMGGVTSYRACADVLAAQPTWATFKVGILQDLSSAQRIMLTGTQYQFNITMASVQHHNGFFLQVKAVPYQIVFLT